MRKNELTERIRKIKSCLCVGLDTDPEKLPATFSIRDARAMADFNKAIIDATLDHCVSYKINTAFYESLGAAGWSAMEETVNHIPDSHFKIADAKRGDIGNTSGQYAKAFFETLPFDAITLHPYMGKDSIAPFLTYEGKWAILLALTSNPGAEDFEMLPLKDEKEVSLFEKVMDISSNWGHSGNMMYVTGATRPEQLGAIRQRMPDHFFLVPGVGAQGGTVEEVCRYGLNKDIGLLINVSRSIIYASSGHDFAEKAAEAARTFHEQMKPFIS